MAWAGEDRFFPLEHGRRLAEQLPQGRFEAIPGSRTFVPEDQPERLAELIAAFASGAPVREVGSQRDSGTADPRGPQ